MIFFDFIFLQCFVLISIYNSAHILLDMILHLSVYIDLFFYRFIYLYIWRVASWTPRLGCRVSRVGTRGIRSPDLYSPGYLSGPLSGLLQFNPLTIRHLKIWKNDHLHSYSVKSYNNGLYLYHTNVKTVGPAMS